MLTSSIVRVADFCVRRAFFVIALVVALAAGSAVYATRHFAIKTDVTDLFPPDLPWTRRALDFMKVFPQPDILVVVDGPIPEFVEEASNKLAQAFTARSDLIRGVHQLDSGSFFERNGLMFLPTEETARVTSGLTQAKPLIEMLSADPSLRGSLSALSFGLMGVEGGLVKLDDLAWPMTEAANTAAEALAGRPAAFSWQALASGKPPEPHELRRFVAVEPVLDYSALEPGRAATDAISKTARDLKLDTSYQARVGQTGLVPVDDDEFASLREHAGLNVAVSILGVLLVLWLALRWRRIVLALALSLFAGMTMSLAFGLLMVGALNLIFVAFFALFVGIGVDFGIQFSVRYRAERHELRDLRDALISAARKAGAPLALAAAATAVGFSSFVPTAYRGLAELGQIAGSGMIIAFLTSITLLPALLSVLKPPAEARPMGIAALAPVDRFIERHRRPVIVITILVVVLASPLVAFLPFDFNPLHLRNPKVESVATFLELRKDPRTGANAIEIMAPNLAAAAGIAERLGSVPEVSQTITLDSLVPGDQDAKLALIQKAATAIGSSLNPAAIEPRPTDAENVKALTSTAATLSTVAETSQGPGVGAAKRLSGLLLQLATSEPRLRRNFETALVEPLRIALEELRQALQAQRITTENIPADLARLWVSPDGRARVQVLAYGDPDDTAVIRNFVTTVLAVEPNATGPAVMLFEAGNTIVRSFIEAAIFAVLAIATLLWIALRRVADVLLTLVPLLVAGVVTLELCSAFDLPLNFANIIALPVLLGVGVAFKIYYIMAWRSGQTALVQSPLTRAVMFSDGDRLRQPVVIERSRHLEYGSIDGAGAGLYDDSRGVLSTRSDGAAALPGFSVGTRIRAAAAGSTSFQTSRGRDG
jgi:hopanoid biosynthesis associated RND transporter like protein HpnN